MSLERSWQGLLVNSCWLGQLGQERTEQVRTERDTDRRGQGRETGLDRQARGPKSDRSPVPVGELAVLAVGGDGCDTAVHAALDLQVFLRAEAGQFRRRPHDGAPVAEEGSPGHARPEARQNLTRQRGWSLG